MPQYGANAAAPAGGGFLANALGNLQATQNVGPQVSDDELAELDAISQEYHTTAGPIVVEQIEEPFETEGN